MKPLLLIACALLLCATPNTHAQGIIKGTLLGYDGQPMERASIQLVTNEMTFPRAVIRRFPVAADGTFSVPVDPPGLFRLQFSGFFHEAYEVPIYLAADDTVDVEVVPGTTAYLKGPDTLRVYLTMYAAGERTRDEVLLDDENQDGRFTLSIPAGYDSVYYAIKARSWRAHGPAGDRFPLDLRGEYDSIIDPPGGRDTTLIIDTAPLPAEAMEPRFLIRSGPDETLKFAGVYQDFEIRDRKSSAYYRAERSKGVPDYNIEYDWRKDIRELERQLRRENDPFTEQVRYLMLMYAGFSDEWLDWEPDRALAEDVLERIPPTSPLLSFFPALIQGAIKSASKPERQVGEPERDLVELQDAAQPYADYVYALSYLHPDSSARRNFLSGAIHWSFQHKQFESFEQYFNEYMSVYGGTERAEILAKQYNPQKEVAPGSKVPDFSFVSMDDPARTITPETLRGTSYLISFWATWCGPCITKMEDLHRMYEHYAGDDFEILSVSINFQEEHAIDFRKDKWPMPWLNTHIENWAPDEGVLKAFEVIGIPKTILVDGEGYIVAVESDKEAFYDAIIAHMGR